MSQARLSATTTGRRALYTLIPLIPRHPFTFGDLKTDAKQQALIALHGAGYLRKVQRIRQNRRYVWQWEATSKFWRKFGHGPIEG